ncbi:hypothetical protein [Spirosoma rigui]|uniref:hypothetical protein n=1 Tax=Spirosoma rigui TaxID=564064 RepID=UPI0009B0F31B|nr:hypothetical protein [Spirosoma rigui]
MAANTHPITIEKVNPDGTLVLSDHGNTIASRGDTILWHIGKNSGVESITAIRKDSELDVFVDPGPAPLGKNWSGVIRDDLSIPCEEKYSICYKPVDSTVVHCFDPKIQVNS